MNVVLLHLMTSYVAYDTATAKFYTLSLHDALPISCTPAAGDVSWCPTTGNNLVTLVINGGGWEASMTNNNLTTPLVTCSIFVNEAGPVGAAISEGAPACK